MPTSLNPIPSSMKLKDLLQTLIFSPMASKAKSLITQLLKDINFIPFPPLKHKNKPKKLFFGSFRLHYNWCSNSQYHPLPPHQTSCHYHHSHDLSTYLQWLDQKPDQESMNEIDKLADLFIADSHEKFRLEKQESYRLFQEMMARSV